MAIREDELYEKVSDLHCVQVGRWMLTVLLMEKASEALSFRVCSKPPFLPGLA